MLLSSHTDHGKPAESGKPSTSQRSTPETERTAPEAVSWARRAGAADERAANGQWEQAEGAGDRAKGGRGSCYPTGFKLSLLLGISFLSKCSDGVSDHIQRRWAVPVPRAVDLLAESAAKSSSLTAAGWGSSRGPVLPPLLTRVWWS